MGDPHAQGSPEHHCAKPDLPWHGPQPGLSFQDAWDSPEKCIQLKLLTSKYTLLHLEALPAQFNVPQGGVSWGTQERADGGGWSPPAPSQGGREAILTHSEKHLPLHLAKESWLLSCPLLSFYLKVWLLGISFEVRLQAAPDCMRRYCIRAELRKGPSFRHAKLLYGWSPHSSWAEMPTMV